MGRIFTIRLGGCAVCCYLVAGSTDGICRYAYDFHHRCHAPQYDSWSLCRSLGRQV